MRRLIYCFVIAILSIALTACAGSKTPQMIASYPSNGQSSPPVSPPPDQAQRVYNTQIFLQVASVERAAQEARDLAARYGGYLAGWNMWEQQDGTSIQLILEVPAPYFDLLRKDILDLGSLVSESADSTWNPAAYGWDAYSEITLTLTPASTWRPVVHLPGGWNPFHTFQQSLGVSWRIIGFLVDLLIWVLVVAGPFVLLGWGIRKLISRPK